jgi:small subunit ribosomal protein S19e
MISVQEVEAKKFIAKLKEELKTIEQIQPPEWAAYIKSGVHRERPPDQTDFWFIRSAAILRRLYLDGPVGVSRLRTYFGGRKRRGTKPARFRKSSGAIIRRILQQLEAAGLVKKEKKGRVLSNKGRSLLDKVAYEVK